MLRLMLKVGMAEKETIAAHVRVAFMQRFIAQRTSEAWQVEHLTRCLHDLLIRSKNELATRTTHAEDSRSRQHHRFTRHILFHSLSRGEHKKPIEINRHLRCTIELPRRDKHLCSSLNCQSFSFVELEVSPSLSLSFYLLCTSNDNGN